MLVGFLVDCESFIEIDYSMFNVKKIGFIFIGLWEEYFFFKCLMKEFFFFLVFEFFVMLMLIFWFMLFLY